MPSTVSASAGAREQSERTGDEMDGMDEWRTYRTQRRFDHIRVAQALSLERLLLKICVARTTQTMHTQVGRAQEAGGRGRCIQGQPTYGSVLEGLS